MSLKSEKPAAKEIKNAVGEVLSNKSYKKNAQSYGKELRSGGGYVAAAEAILEYVYGNKQLDNKEEIVGYKDS